MIDAALRASKILVVDDEPANVLLVERFLQKSGYTNVKTTTDAAQVASLYREFQPHLVLLDLMMPHMDGFEVMRQLEPWRKETYTPILVLTADINSDTKMRAFNAGASDYVTKPIDMVELLARVRSALRLKVE